MMWILFTIFVLFLVLFLILCDADLTLLFYHSFCSRKDFGGQVVWITGASSGIGEYLAYSFAKKHAKLVLSGVNTERLEKVGKHCIELGKCSENDVLLLPFKIDDFGVHEECVKKVLEHFGDIDILVNNAGVSQRADFQDIDIEVDIHLFNVNVFGAINLTRKVLKHFLKKNKGQIIVCSSMAGKLGAPFSSAYTGSKHALHGYFECLRTELIPTNINVTIVCPGPVFSRITDRCVTGKLGEPYDHVQQPNDRKMKTDRCSELMLTAISHKLDECWISQQLEVTMCPVVLLALLFSFLLLLLEVTAAINVTFNLPNITLNEEEVKPIYFSISDKTLSEPDEGLYRIISEDDSIASVVNSTIKDDVHFNSSFLVRGNFLGRTSIRVIKTVNGTIKDKSQLLPVAVIRREALISKIFTISVAVLVSLNYINMGCALDLSVVSSVLKKPIAPGIGFISQYVVMPVVSYSFAKLLLTDVVYQLGLFTFGCSPGGAGSNMWTVLLNGNLNLSITMTLISNIVALGMMPLWLFTLGRSLFSEIKTTIPFGNICFTLLAMLIPLAIGLSFQKWHPRVAKFCRRILAPVSVCMILFIIIFGTYANLYMFKLFTWKMLLAAGANVWIGFFFGTVISKAFDLNLEDIIAVAVETGVQNTGIAIVLVRISLGQPESDIASVVPVAASIMTPLPLLCAYIVIKVRNYYFPKVEESRLYVMDDEDEKKTLPSPDTSDSMLISKIL